MSGRPCPIHSLAPALITVIKNKEAIMDILQYLQLQLNRPYLGETERIKLQNSILMLEHTIKQDCRVHHYIL